MNNKIIINIFKTKAYLNLLIFVTLILILITVILQVNVIPNLKKIAFDNILNESKKVSNYMSSLIDYELETVEVIDKKLRVLIDDFNIDKIHYFNRNGKILYSTKKEKIGTFNTNNYFKDIISEGKLYYSLKLKGSKTSEDELTQKSVVEIYVPIIKNNSFSGAFELYYDISKNVKETSAYTNLIFKLNLLISFAIFISFFILLYWISAKSLKEKELISKDYLTNLYNRRYFYEIIENFMNLSKRNKTSISLCMIDIDNFKNINDKYGHGIGDTVLKTFAKEIKKIIRNSDIVVRFGGEEFLLLLPNTSINNAEVLANKVCTHFNDLSSEVHFTVSIGIAEYKKDKSIDTLINEADKCLYQAKEKGKNQSFRLK
jgi:diguanylate cyclase (GGDEF)-like protein